VSEITNKGKWGNERGEKEIISRQRGFIKTGKGGEKGLKNKITGGTRQSYRQRAKLSLPEFEVKQRVPVKPRSLGKGEGGQLPGMIHALI